MARDKSVRPDFGKVPFLIAHLNHRFTQLHFAPSKASRPSWQQETETAMRKLRDEIIAVLNKN